MDGGTLNQLRNLINRRNVTKDPTKNYTASEEFFTLVTEGHLDKEMPQAIAVDSVYEYACEVLTLGMFQKEFDDCIRESDGLRDVRCWRYFLLLFKSNHRTNYSIEAFIFLCQYHFMLSPRLAMQLTWSRTVNTHGLPGRNCGDGSHIEKNKEY